MGRSLAPVSSRPCFRLTIHGLDTVFYALDRDAWDADGARYELRWS
ncbi:MAG TPA: hypothetical protein VF121_04695 [Thermoanaerobaculia bacterium]|nr:hypothetical protein [Thermoanaerobaculia bacterium]